ncbi:hypothetical protein MASR2M79_25080 [Aminivibrio sp.]
MLDSLRTIRYTRKRNVQLFPYFGTDKLERNENIKLSEKRISRILKEAGSENKRSHMAPEVSKPPEAEEDSTGWYKSMSLLRLAGAWRIGLSPRGDR